MNLTSYDKKMRSVNWLRDNYSHIWDNPRLNVDEKAGFLAASCHPTRCFLMTLDLPERLDIIRNAIIEDQRQQKAMEAISR